MCAGASVSRSPADQRHLEQGPWSLTVTLRRAGPSAPVALLRYYLICRDHEWAGRPVVMTVEAIREAHRAALSAFPRKGSSGTGLGESVRHHGVSSDTAVEPLVGPHDAASSLGHELRACARAVAQTSRHIVDADAVMVVLLSRSGGVLLGQDGLPASLAGEVWLPADPACDELHSNGDFFVSSGRPTPILPDHPINTTAGPFACYARALQPSTGRTWLALYVALHSWSVELEEQVSGLADLAAAAVESRLLLDKVVELDRLAAGMSQPLNQLAEVVRRSTDLIELPDDPRLPRLADLMKARLGDVEAAEEELAKARAAYEISAADDPVREVDVAQLVLGTARDVFGSSWERHVPTQRRHGSVTLRTRPQEVARQVTTLLTLVAHHAGDDERVAVAVYPKDGAAEVSIELPGRGVPAADLARVVARAGEGDCCAPPLAVSLSGERTEVARGSVCGCADGAGTRLTLTLRSDGQHLPGKGPDGPVMG